MNENVGKMLEEEIVKAIELLSTLEPWCKERINAIEDLTVLHKLRIEEQQLRSNLEETLNANLDKERAGKDQLRDRYLKLGIDVASIILPLVFYAAWMKRGFRFEETGTYTSTTFKGLFNRFKPTIK